MTQGLTGIPTFIVYYAGIKDSMRLSDVPFTSSTIRSIVFLLTNTMKVLL